MASSGILEYYGLEANPFTDRIAERTALDTSSTYVHSDLQVRNAVPLCKNLSLLLQDVRC